MEDKDNGHDSPTEIAGIYRANPDGTFEGMESVRVEAGEEATMFATHEGIVVVIGPVTHHETGELGIPDPGT